MRFLAEVMEETRKQIDPDFPISVRFSVEENSEGGRRKFESRQMLMDIEDCGWPYFQAYNG